MAKATTKAASKSSKAVKTADKPKRPGIGKMVIAMLEEGKLSPDEILAKILKDVEGAKTTISCIYWYANNQGISLAERRKNGDSKDPKNAEKTKTKGKVQGEVRQVNKSASAKKAEVINRPARQTPKEIVADAIRRSRLPRGAK